MAKVIDIICFSCSIFLLLFAWIGIYINITLAFILSSTMTVIFLVTFLYFKNHTNKPYDCDRLALELSIKGTDYLTNIIKSILKNGIIENGFNWILLKNALIYCNFRFSLVGVNDISNIYSLTLQKGKKQVFLLARGIDRKAVHLLELQSIKINLIKIKGIYSFLESNNALPKLEKVKHKISLKFLLFTILSRANTKNYFFAGAVMISVAFITPLKLYYLIFGSISILLALITLSPIGNGSITHTNSLNALKAECNKIDVSSFETMQVDTNKSFSDNQSDISTNDMKSDNSHTDNISSNNTNTKDN